jgi:hypothetical protein
MVTLAAPPVVHHGGAEWRFEGWSDGGAASHERRFAQGETVVARYVPDLEPHVVFADHFESGDAAAWSAVAAEP